MNELRPLRSDASKRSGFTLVEVVIALAIFVFGALAIIRIFPPALGVIQNSGDRMVGNNLNRSLLARYDRSPELVPDGIYDPDRAVATWNDPSYVLYGSVAGSRRNKSIPSEQGIAGFEKSALARYRNIVGERHTVPKTPDDNNPATTDTKFVYTQFPFRETTLTAYQEDSLSGVVINAAGRLNFDSATHDSDNSKYTPAVGDFTYVSYRWLENGRYWSVDQERIVMSAATEYDVVQAARNPGPVTLIAAGEVKVRLRRQLAIGTVVGTDPFYIKADDPKTGLVRTILPKDTTISFDYTVEDWRWLVVDSTPSANPNPDPDPSSTPPPADLRVVNLPVRHLDTESYPFLVTAYPTQPAGTAAEPVIKTSLDAVYDNRTIPQQGTVPFTVDPTVTTAPEARVVFRTADNWTQQLSVAANNYTLYYDDTITPQAPDTFWRQCYLDANGPFLYFHPGEAGKTLLVSYRYRSGATPNDDTVMENQLLTVDTDIISPAPTSVPAAFSSQEGGVARLQFVNVDGEPLTQQITAITKIQGVGIQSRVAWLDGSRFTQVSASRLRGGDVQ